MRILCYLDCQVIPDHSNSLLYADDLQMSIPGETFILYNQQTKGNKRELIQFGVPIFERIKEGTADQSQQSMKKPPIQMHQLLSFP